MHELMMWINEALHQIFGQGGKPRYHKQIAYQQPPDGIYVTKKAASAMAAYGVTRDAVRDVLAHGEQKKSYIKVRAYNGYEIGIAYGKSAFSNQQVIYSVWKQPNKQWVRR